MGGFFRLRWLFVLSLVPAAVACGLNDLAPDLAALAAYQAAHDGVDSTNDSAADADAANDAAAADVSPVEVTDITDDSDESADVVEPPKACSPVDCDDDNPCTVDVCKPTGFCKYEAGGDNKPCDDGSACTTDDRCDDTHCAGIPARFSVKFGEGDSRNRRTVAVRATGSDSVVGILIEPGAGVFTYDTQVVRLDAKGEAKWTWNAKSIDDNEIIRDVAVMQDGAIAIVGAHDKSGGKRDAWFALIKADGTGTTFQLQYGLGSSDEEYSAVVELKDGVAVAMNTVNNGQKNAEIRKIGLDKSNVILTTFYTPSLQIHDIARSPKGTFAFAGEGGSGVDGGQAWSATWTPGGQQPFEVAANVSAPYTAARHNGVAFGPEGQIGLIGELITNGEVKAGSVIVIDKGQMPVTTIVADALNLDRGGFLPDGSLVAVGRQAATGNVGAMWRIDSAGTLAYTRISTDVGRYDCISVDASTGRYFAGGAHFKDAMGNTFYAALDHSDAWGYTSCETANSCGGLFDFSQCADTKACTLDTCEHGSGCANPITELLPCDDDNPCTIADSCTAGACTVNKPKDCDDNNPCTADSCDPVGKIGCVHEPTAGNCDDGNPCTIGTCFQGKCDFANKPNLTVCLTDKACKDGKCL